MVIGKIILENMEKCLAFRGIVEAGSIHKASHSLHISQPSLSVKLKSLEESLGVKLVERSSRGIIVTSAGQKLVDFVDQTNKSALNLSNELSCPNGSLGGTIRVGIYESIARYFWPIFFKRFHAEFPEITIHLSTGRSESLISQTLDCEIDLALTIEPPIANGLSNTELFRDHFSIYGSVDLIGNRKSNKSNGVIPIPNELFARYPLISFGSAIASRNRVLDNDLVDCGFDPANNYKVESFEIALEFCLQNIGWVVIPNKVAQRDVTSGRLKKISMTGAQSVDFSEHTICISTLKDREKSPLLKLVSEQVIQIMNQMRRP